MTETELLHLLRIQEEKVRIGIKEAAKTVPSIKNKFYKGKLWRGTQFTLDEIKVICEKIGVNDLLMNYIEENWQEKPETDIYTLKGTKEFLKKFEENPAIQCCNTCKYLCGKALNSKMPKPFCKIYNRLLENFNANVYEDYCSSYSYIEFPKPRQWYKENAPSNLNMFGEKNTVNGVNLAKFKTERSSDFIKLVNKDSIGLNY